MATSDGSVPVSAYDVAAVIFAEQQAAGRTVDKLQLEKWLYLVQGAHLVLWDTPAFREPLHAYRNGPVVRTVEQTYRESTPGRELDHAIGGRVEQVPGDVVETIQLVLKYFGTWAGPALEKFTKLSGSPWRIARGDLPKEEESAILMDATTVRSWFHQHGIAPNRGHLSKADREAFERLAQGDADALSILLG